MSPITAAHEQQRKQLLSSEDHENAVVYIKERRTACSVFTSWFGSFAMGVIAASAVFVLLSMRGHLVIKPTYSFAKNNALPDVPLETITFKADPVFSARASDESDYAWNMLLPAGRGYVFVDNPSDRGLAPGEETKYGPIYSVSMYHQLHCLARLRKMQWILIDGLVTGEETIARSFVGREDMSHVQHCFDYLRQGILCAGDMTLEWPRQDGPSSGVAVDGWGVPHQCKSATAIQDFMTRFHFNESITFDAAG